MEQTPYETPVSELGNEKQEGIKGPVKKPWGIYLVAAWCFFGLGGFTNIIFKSFLSTIKEDSPQLAPLVGLVYGVALIGLVVGTLKLNRFWLILCAALMGLLALFQLFSIGTFVIADQISISILVLKLFYVIPSIACAWYCARPSLLKTSNDYTAYKKQLAMQKYVQKKLVQGKV